MNGLLVKIMSPDYKVEYTDVTSLVLQGFDGEYCIQYNHMPMALNTVEGNAVITDASGKHTCSIRGKGFAFVNKNKVVVFVDGVKQI